MAVSSPVQDSASALRAEQLEQAEELLFSGAARARIREGDLSR